MTPTEKQKQKTAKKENTKATNMSYLLDSRINDYSFLHFPKKLLEELLGKRHGIAD